MKLKKQIVIVAEVICDEDFDCSELLIAQDIGNDTMLDTPRIYVGRGMDDEWEVLGYIFQNDVVIE